MTDTDKHYAIRRIERNGHTLWQVRFMRNGKVFSGSFTDSHYGGREAAFQAAQAYRNQALLENPPQSKHLVRQRKRKGAPGMAGVFRSVRKDKHGKEIVIWRAVTRLPNGRYLSRSFYVSRYGEERAQQLAEHERLKHLAEIEDRPYLLSEQGQQLFAELVATSADPSIQNT